MSCFGRKHSFCQRGAKPSNMIRGISLKNVKAAIRDLGSEINNTVSLLGCTYESDLLLMMNL